MKASVRWLRELCPELPDDASLLATRLTAAGLEVEAIHPFGLPAETCVVASVVSSRPHPSRSGLRLVTVERGGGLQEVVCGAANVPAPGGLVVLAPLGTHLPAKGMTIERRTIAGVASEGMLCSEEELGLGDRAEGILVLPPGTAAPGTSLARALPSSRDSVLEIGLTPNRADGLGHLGLAREAAALFEVPFTLPEPPGPALPDALAKFVTVQVEDAPGCAHYGAAVLLGVQVAPSPFDVRWRLAALGVRPISNVVDVTNWVMLEFGHPMHAFDLDRVRRQQIVVRRARAGEKLDTLDGVARTLSTDDLVVCDGDGPVALAGVMGGQTSEIAATTTRVLLECAYFDPRVVRRAARRHGLHTESSHRFERGVDTHDTRAALAQAVALVGRLAGATVGAPPQVIEARPLPRRTVTLRHERLEGLLGVEVDRDEAVDTLKRLGFVGLSSRPDLDAWEVPSHRGDVTREVDLIEEVARVRGYDSIPSVLPAVRAPRDHGPKQALARRARGAAVALGLSEAITYSLVARRELEAVGAPAPAVAVRNPLRDEQSVLRTSLLPGLLQVVSRGRRHGERDARLFTVGTLFAASGQPSTQERLGFVALLSGERASWLGKPLSVDVWDAKGLAEGLVRRMFHRDAEVRLAPAASRPRHLHPRGAALVEVEGRGVGTLGPLHPDVAEAFDVPEDAVALELDLEALARVGVRSTAFTPLPRFPGSVRDIAVVVREDVPAGHVENAVRAAASDLAERVTIFDRFTGGGIPAGHVSLGLHVIYRARDRTLTDLEVDARHEQVVSEIQRQFGGQLRA